MPVFIRAGSDPAEMPLSPAVSVSGGRTVYLSGATPLPFIHSHPHVEEELSIADDLYSQAMAALKNLEIEVTAAGGSKADIVTIMVYSTRMSEQAELNRAYLEFFGGHRPARTHVAVAELVEPRMLVEINGIAVIGDAEHESRDRY